MKKIIALSLVGLVGTAAVVSTAAFADTPSRPAPYPGVYCAVMQGECYLYKIPTYPGTIRVDYIKKFMPSSDYPNYTCCQRNDTVNTCTYWCWPTSNSGC